MGSALIQIPDEALSEALGSCLYDAGCYVEDASPVSVDSLRPVSPRELDRIMEERRRGIVPIALREAGIGWGQ